MFMSGRYWIEDICEDRGGRHALEETNLGST